jgi:hypothetical protein
VFGLVLVLVLVVLVLLLVFVAVLVSVVDADEGSVVVIVASDEEDVDDEGGTEGVAMVSAKLTTAAGNNPRDANVSSIRSNRLRGGAISINVVHINNNT